MPSETVSVLSEMVSSSMRRKCTDSDSSHACSKSRPCIYFPFIHSIVSDDSVSGEGRPRSGRADALADLGLCFPHMPEDRLLHGAAHIKI